MNKFPILLITLRALTKTFLWLMNKLLTVVYLCLPIGLFMLIMQLREKNNKANAIGTFTDDRSEFQFIFSDYILVANKPNNLKTNVKKKLTNINNFVDKWKWLFVGGILFSIILTIILVLTCC